MTTTIVLKTIGSTVFMVNCLIQFGQPAWGLPFPTARRLDLDQSLDPRPESGHKTRGWTLDQSPNSNRPMRKLHFIQRFHMTSHIFTLYIIYSNRYSRGLLDLFCIKKKKGTIYITFIKSFSIIKYSITLLQKFEIPATIHKIKLQYEFTSFSFSQFFFFLTTSSPSRADETRRNFTTNRVFLRVRPPQKKSEVFNEEMRGWGASPPTLPPVVMRTTFRFQEGPTKS